MSVLRWPRPVWLVGCYAAISTKGAGPEPPASIHGTVAEDRGDVWAVRTRQRSVNGDHSIEVTIVVPLDGITDCDVCPNEEQQCAHGLELATTTDMAPPARYLGQPSWHWFGRLAPRHTPRRARHATALRPHHHHTRQRRLGECRIGRNLLTTTGMRGFDG